MKRIVPGATATMALCLCCAQVTLRPQEAASQVAGTEIAAAVNLQDRNASLEGRLFVGDDTSEVDCVMVVMQWGLGQVLYGNQDLRAALGSVSCGLLQLRIANISTTSPRVPPSAQLVRNAGVGGGPGLALLLEELAGESARPELAGIPLIFWGHSAAGTFGVTYAAMHPGRTLGFVRYNSHLREVPVDMVNLVGIPGLLIAGELDEIAGVEDTLELWQMARAAGAPWTLAIQPDGPHGSREFLERADVLLLPWVKAVVKARLPSDGSKLLEVADLSTWVGDRETTEIAPIDQFTGSRSEGVWLPDEATARGWRIVVAGGS